MITHSVPFQALCSPIERGEPIPVSLIAQVAAEDDIVHIAIIDEAGRYVTRQTIQMIRYSPPPVEAETDAEVLRRVADGLDGGEDQDWDE